VINVEIAPIKVISTVLAHVFVALKNIQPCELHLFLRKTFKKAEDDNPGHPDPERDCLKHPGFRVDQRKITPTSEIMRQEITPAIHGNNLSMPLVKECHRPACRTRIDSLPQSVEYKNRLIKQLFHIWSY
jgi:hypothetical protein